MATPSKKLADSLEVLRKLQEDGHIAIRSANLSRTHRERLVKNSFLEEALKGCYIPSYPDEPKGESTAWHAFFWQFCTAYLNHLKGDDWCLSPEQSIKLHAANWAVPQQLLVRAVKARNNATPLPHGTSLLVMRSSLPPAKNTSEVNGIRIFALPAALVACGPKFFTQNPTDVRAALSKIRDASEILELLLEGGHSTIAGRLAGAFRNIGRDQIADNIVDTMRRAGYAIREHDLFDKKAAGSLEKSAG